MAAQFSQTVRALAHDSSKSAHVVWIAAGACLLCWAAWFALSSVSVYEISQRARLEVRMASHQVDAQIAGQIVTSVLEIGRDVAAGDVLVELDATRDRLRLAEERARLAGFIGRRQSALREIEARENARRQDRQSAAAAVDVAHAHMQEAQVAIDFSREAEQRITKLLALGAGAKVDGLKAAAETQKQVAIANGWKAEVVRIERDAGSRDHQNEAQVENLRNSLATLDADAATSQATVARLEAELTRYQLRAPVAGRLADVAPVRLGAYVAEGQRLATILPADDLVVVADFAPSLAFGRVRPGQKGRLRLDGFPWAQYGTVAATVKNVAGEIRDNLVRVELSVDDRPASGISLQHGQPGSLEVTVEESSPAALVLRAAGLVLAGGARAGAAP